MSAATETVQRRLAPAPPARDVYVVIRGQVAAGPGREVTVAYGAGGERTATVAVDEPGVFLIPEAVGQVLALCLPRP